MMTVIQPLTQQQGSALCGQSPGDVKMIYNDTVSKPLPRLTQLLSPPQAFL